ncbi:hypothetical protein NQ095_12640 [Rossellomorea sp. SC111]|uniref:hypothetical protein n=1 Tax=Rossellomorea sp. SC111 TaxID=2968985 RepID=UPI00215B162F|nr:hypothetical protein [Rossellomorea sp. SC111]MCR8849262.1 hypothetical protein [Rossellomorea sp. SC111]
MNGNDLKEWLKKWGWDDNPFLNNKEWVYIMDYVDPFSYHHHIRVQGEVKCIKNLTYFIMVTSSGSLV